MQHLQETCAAESPTTRGAEQRFFRWISDVERYLGSDTGADGCPLIESEEAQYSFDEGVDAISFALTIQAAIAARSAVA